MQFNSCGYLLLPLFPLFPSRVIQSGYSNHFHQLGSKEINDCKSRPATTEEQNCANDNQIFFESVSWALPLNISYFVFVLSFACNFHQSVSGYTRPLYSSPNRQHYDACNFLQLMAKSSSMGDDQTRPSSQAV